MSEFLSFIYLSLGIIAVKAYLFGDYLILKKVILILIYKLFYF